MGQTDGLSTLSLSLSLLSHLVSPLGGEKQSQESYGETQATRNEGQNPCASKDAAAAVAAVAETTRAEREARGSETAHEEKQRQKLRRKERVRRREAGERERDGDKGFREKQRE